VQRIVGLVVVFVAGLAGTVEARCTAVERDTDQDGKPDVVLENAFLRVVVNPAAGGSVTHLMHKASGVDLTGGGIKPRPGQGWGVGIDRISPHNRRHAAAKLLEKNTYTHEITRKGPDIAAVRLVGRSPHDDVKFLEVSKELSLRSGEALLRVRYAFANTGGAGSGSQYAAPWMCQILRPDGSRSSPRITFYQPVETGVEAVVYEPKKPTVRNVWRTPVRGWRTVLDDNGRGAAMTFDWENTEVLYSFLPGESGTPDFPTFEWMYRMIRFDPVNLPEGEVSGRPFETGFEILPLAGMKAVHGAAEGLAAAIAWSEEGIPSVRVYSGVPLAGVDVLLSHRMLPASEERSVGTKTADLAADAAKAFRFDAVARAQGRHVFRCRILRGGRTLLDCERDFAIGETEESYVLAPFGKRNADQVPRVDTTVRMDVVSPHVPWLKPYVGGTLSGIFLMPWHAGRETVELAQRLDLDPRLIATYTTQFLQDLNHGRDVLEPELSRRLDAHPDVLIAGGMYWNALSQKAQTRVLEYVSDGGGLVYVWPAGFHLLKEPAGKAAELDPGGLAYLKTGFPFDAVPGWPETPVEKWITAYRLGKGRLIVLNTPIDTDRMHRRWRSTGGITPRNPIGAVRWPFWEYQIGLVAKACLWAAGKEPGVRVADLAVGPARRAFAEGAPLRAVVKVENRSEVAGRFTVRFRVRDEFDEPHGDTVAKDVMLDAGASAEVEATFQAPFAAGLHRVEAFLGRNGKAVDFAVRTFEVERPATLGGHADPAIVKPNGTVRAEAVLETRLGLGDVDVAWRLEDATGRLLQEKNESVTIAAAGKLTLRWEASTWGALRPRHIVRVTARTKDGARLAETLLPFAVDTRRYDDYISLIWDTSGPGYLEDVMRICLDRADAFDTLLVGLGDTLPETMAAFEDHARTGAAHGYRLYASHLYHLRCNDPGVIRKPCLTSEAFFREAGEAIAVKMERFARYAPMGYILGDEMSLGREGQACDFCQSPTCLAEFRRYLQQRYASLEGLNLSWGTTFASWDDVMPQTFEASKTSGRWASWNDHRAFMDTVFAQAFQFVREQARLADPGVLIGFSGGPDMNLASVGFDRWKLYQICRAVNDYGADTPEQQRSFMGEGPRMSSWWWGMYGGGVRSARRFSPWNCIFNGLNTSSFFATRWRQHSVFYDLSLVHLDGTPKADVTAGLAADVGTLRQGLGKALLQWKRESSGIAVLFSQQCERAAAMTGVEGRVSPLVLRDARLGFEAAVRDLGLGFSIVAPAQIEDGGLEGQKILFLPYAQSMTPGEADAIRRLVEAGGTVVADGFVARFDHHLRPLDRGLLDDLFGVSFGEAREARSDVCVTLAGTKARLGVPPVMQDFDAVAGAEAVAGGGEGTRPVTWGTLRVEGGGTARKAVPAILVNQIGDGRAITLNFDFTTYREMRGAGTAGPLLSWLGGLLREAGVQASAPVSSAGKPVIGLGTYRYHSGEATLIGLLPDPGISGAGKTGVDVSLAEPRHVYDALTGKYLGQKKNLRLPVAPAEARVLAALAAKPAGLTLEPVAEAKRGRTVTLVARFEPRLEGVGHVVHFRLVDPVGRERRLYRSNVLSTNGRFVVEIPLALNDPVGEWKVTAREALTGLAATGHFALK